MGVYQRKDSPGKWWISYTLNGKYFRQPAGTTKRQAEQLLAKIKTDIYNGTHFPDKQRSELTMDGLLALWTTQACKRKSFSTDLQRFKTMVAHFGAKTMINTLRANDIEGLKNTLRDRKTRRDVNLAPATINRHLTVLKTAFNLAVRNQHLHRNPMIGVRMLPEHNKRDRICSDDEYHRLLEATNSTMRLAIIFGNTTGMRMGEICALRWGDIDLKKAVIRIRHGTTKTGEGREIPIIDELAVALANQPRAIDGRLFKIDRRSLSPAFRRLCRKLGINDLRFHDLRHTAATRLRRGGADLFTIAAITGHKDLTTLQRYNSITLDDKRQAFQRITQR